ncbi:hypothetical protein PHLCEN_2v13035 [Hermanssonia centrifuga]|uniref:Uncharacterized protein n=1 Tax=Hermanssonia centrifuga TaxID=98765 RepID=A0A2R6NFE3_9APHY|nr:hypothetical protein PHLCEN_2v13035 [Hermanssonia centrifuga]
MSYCAPVESEGCRSAVGHFQDHTKEIVRAQIVFILPSGSAEVPWIIFWVLHLDSALSAAHLNRARDEIPSQRKFRCTMHNVDLAPVTLGYESDDTKVDWRTIIGLISA